MRRARYPLFILGFLLLALPTVDADPKSEPATKGPECVILLHGLGRTSRSLNKMADALQAAGWLGKGGLDGLCARLSARLFAQVVAHQHPAHGMGDEMNGPGLHPGTTAQAMLDGLQRQLLDRLFAR